MASFVAQSKENLARNRNWRPQASLGRAGMVRRNIDYYPDQTNYLVNLEEHFKLDPI